MNARSRANSSSGQALVEFALVLPILVLLLLGIYDFARAIRVYNAIINMSREGANLASRTPLAPQDVMNAVAITAQPLDMKDNGMMYVTYLQGNGGQPQVVAQYGWQNSSLNGSISSRMEPGSLTLATGKTATVVEVFYNYQSLFSSNAVMLGKQFHAQAIF